MDAPDRLFRVVVLGGIALAAPSSALLQGCGGTVSTTADAGATAADASTDALPETSTDGSGDAPDACFPHETALSLDAACGR